jgi:hypothetical protein
LDEAQHKISAASGSAESSSRGIDSSALPSHRKTQQSNPGPDPGVTFFHHSHRDFFSLFVASQEIDDLRIGSKLYLPKDSHGLIIGISRRMQHGED